MTLISRKGFLAIKQPDFKKIEAELRGGMVTISQRINVIAVPLVMSYLIDDINYLSTGDKVILRGDAGTKPWAKQVFNLDDKEFVLCPESEVLGFAKESK